MMPHINEADLGEHEPVDQRGQGVRSFGLGFRGSLALLARNAEVMPQANQPVPHRGVARRNGFNPYSRPRRFRPQECGGVLPTFRRNMTSRLEKKFQIG